MSSFLRRHMSYANVAATLALVFAMGGSAVAAKHYLLHSTKQISPKLLRQLRGRTGAKGATGAPGPTGPQGATGPSGSPASVLASGQSESGDFVASEHYVASFQAPLQAAIPGSNTLV